MGNKFFIGMIFLGALSACTPVSYTEIITEPSRPTVYRERPTVYVTPMYSRNYYSYPSHNTYRPYYSPRMRYHHR